PLVLRADRGRGNSAALGMAAAELLAQGVAHIIVTAPHRNAVSTLFAHALRLGCGIAQCSDESPKIRFIPPDELLRHLYPCDLLLVDEAAAIPAPLLEQLLRHHARIVFATTVHGYEGSGQGFALRFFKTLDALAPGWKLLELHAPIRWADNDPLERLTYDLLLLDAAPAADAQLRDATTESIHYEVIDGGTLTRNEPVLSELFGLLVLAHYRTTPLDLRQLLDSPNLTIHIARHHDHIVGTALTLREGGFAATLAAQIYSGERRPRGHLAPQSLAFHCGVPDAPQLVTERIMRIAIHPAVQRRGIGSALLTQVMACARQEHIDYLSTSFGATTELLNFWQRSTFLPVRIGLTREASSGHHSALLMHPLSAASMALFTRARRRFLGYLPLMLSDPLRDLAPELAAQLLSGELPEHSPHLDADDWRDLHSFATTHRSYETCLGAIHKLARQALANPLLMAELTINERRLLIAKVLQRQSWSEVHDYCQTNGKEEVVKVLRRVIGKIVQLMAPGGEQFIQKP
ncbi:MAG TPA: GNAT family N-acetyltransferase, partial [Gammaproteobacteria bacterium]